MESKKKVVVGKKVVGKKVCAAKKCVKKRVDIKIPKEVKEKAEAGNDVGVHPFLLVDLDAEERVSVAKAMMRQNSTVLDAKAVNEIVGELKKACFWNDPWLTCVLADSGNVVGMGASKRCRYGKMEDAVDIPKATSTALSRAARSIFVG